MDRRRRPAKPWRLVAGLAVTLAGLLAGAAMAPATAAPRPSEGPPVYPASPGSGPLLEYVKPDGLGLEHLTLDEVRARWGPPDVDDDVPYDRHRDTGGHRTWRYPSAGLEFQVGAWDNEGRNPRVGWVKVSLPFDGRTPHGLYLGMPQAQAMEIVQRHYRVRSRIDATWGRGEERGLLVGASNHGWRQSQRVSFTFRQGRLHEMSYQLKPTPWIEPGAMHDARRFVILAGLLLAATWLLRRLKQGMGVWWQRAQGLLGVLLLGGGVYFVVAGAQLLGSGDGFGRLAGLVLALAGLGGVVIGGAMLAVALLRRRRE